MNQLVVQYVYLQLLDLLTTLAFLQAGVGEGNPLVRAAMAVAASPLAGLVAVKIAALALGMYCGWSGRRRALIRINWLFAAIVVWNLAALLVRTARTQV